MFADYELKKQEDALSTKISAQAALYGKSAGKVLRFAGILHILEFTVNHLRPSEWISPEILQKAIELVEWFLLNFYHLELEDLSWKKI